MAKPTRVNPHKGVTPSCVALSVEEGNTPELMVKVARGWDTCYNFLRVAWRVDILSDQRRDREELVVENENRSTVVLAYCGFY